MRRTHLPWALGILVGLGACSDRGPRVRDVKFPPGNHVARAEGIEIELVSALYDERGVSLRFAVKNRKAAAIAIERDGILLDHAGLEFPIATDPEPTIAALTNVAAKSEVHLDARFVFGHRLEETAILRLRSLRRGDTWVDPVQLAIPPGFAAADEQARAEP